jgi:hypothetical protein
MKMNALLSIGSLAMGFTTMAITSVGFAAQAAILANGGFVPSNVAHPNHQVLIVFQRSLFLIGL